MKNLSPFQVFGLGIFINSLLCLAIPWITILSGVSGLVAVRIVQGVAQGFAYPSIHALYGHWAPVNEKSKMVSFTLSGVSFGIVLANMLSGVIAVKYGWPSIFYFSGIFGIVWYIVWTIIVRKSPEYDSMISDKEKSYILKNTEKSNFESQIPWKAILKSVPVWATSVTLCLYNYGFFTSITQLPMYLSGLIFYSDSANFFNLIEFQKHKTLT